MPRGIRTDHPRSVNALVREAVNHLIADVQAALTGNILLSAAGLAIGTVSAAKIKHNAFHVQFAGIRTTVAAGEVAFTATTHDIADPDAAGREAKYTISVTSAGTVTITKGTTAALGASVAPATPSGHVKIGEVKIAHDGTAIFDASTDELSAAHLTDTYTDETPFTMAAEEITV